MATTDEELRVIAAFAELSAAMMEQTAIVSKLSEATTKVLNLTGKLASVLSESK